MGNTSLSLTLLMATFAFGRGKMFNGKILAPSAFCTLPLGGEIFWRLFEDVLSNAAFFSIDTGIFNSLPVSPGGFSYKFPLRRLMTFDGRK
jgi:hypothetical protein